jgi:hypothetical protein
MKIHVQWLEMVLFRLSMSRVYMIRIAMVTIVWHKVLLQRVRVCKLLLGGADCWIDSDCEFNHCQTTQAIGVLGSCTCNPTTTSGCNGRETCYSADEQDLATSIVDVGPRCLLPVGATCTDAAECLTDACASIDGSGTNKECVCNSTNYPCADGKACVNGT